MKKLRKEIFTPTDLNNHLLYRLESNDRSLVRVIFCSRNLGDQGVRLLTEALRGNCNLSALDLSSNRIESEGAQSISSLLIHQNNMNSNSGMARGIKTLILSENNLGDDGVRSVARALENNKSLESLWVDDNSIGAVGLKLLSHSLQKNQRLERLHLKHNSFQSLSPLIECAFNKKSLNSVAESNHTLKHVFLNCGYSYECDELERILRINRLGKVEARRTKIAMYLEKHLNVLLQLDMDTLVLPRMLCIIGQNGNMSTMYRLVQNLPSELFIISRANYDDPMDVEYL